MAGGCPKYPFTGLRATSDFLYWTERDAIRQSVFDRDPPLCIWCHRTVGDHRSESYFTVDHVRPRRSGGAYQPDNLVLSCRACNIDRGDRSILEYLAARLASAPSHSFLAGRLGAHPVP